MAETLDPKIEKECRRPAFCRAPEGAVEVGGVAIPAFPGEQTLQTGMSQANNREHKHHALCMLVQETSTNEFGCDTTAAGQGSESPQAGHH